MTTEHTDGGEVEADDTARPALIHERQQMLMARPWEAAGMDEIWEITGEYSAGKGTFTRCLAVVVWIGEETGAPIFRFLGHLGDGALGLVGPANINSARRLLLVLADEPGTAYYIDDQPHLDAR